MGLARMASATLLLSVALAGPVCGGTLDFSARVAVDVSPSGHLEPLDRCLRAELQRIPGVSVAGQEPEWILNVTALENHDRRDSSRRHVLAVIFKRPFSGTPLLKSMAGKQYEGVIEDMTADVYRVSPVQLFASADLVGSCRAIVKAFESQELSKKRKLLETLREDLEDRH